MAKKRGNNDGTIRQRPDGVWEARITIGYDVNGHQIQKSIYGGSQAKVQLRMKEIQLQINRGVYVEPSKLTVSQWMDRWFDVYGLPRWREKTAEVHRDNIRLHLKPALGALLLNKLRTDHIQNFINAQQRKGLSSATIRKQLEPLKSALKQAVDTHVLSNNPADKVKLPQQEQKVIQFLSVDEQRVLLSGLPDNTQGRAIRFILGTGLRASELCGLRWMDIDGDSFTVRQSAQFVRNGSAEKGETKQRLSLAEPKTKAGRRIIPLTDTMMQLLEQQRQAQIKQRFSIGLAWRGGQPGSGETPVFATEVGTIFDRNNIDRTLRACLERTGLPQRGLHALRHTFATNWVHSKGDLRTLSEILGHTNVSFTMQQYVHSNMDIKRAGLLAVESMV